MFLSTTEFTILSRTIILKGWVSDVCMSNVPRFLSTTELKILSDYNSLRVLSVICRVMSCVPKFKHGIISKRIEIEGSHCCPRRN